ncbi:MAG: hypothetical protein AB2L14_21810 [Candidatus Xenobiia bacterium LiM19]
MTLTVPERQGLSHNLFTILDQAPAMSDNDTINATLGKIVEGKRERLHQESGGFWK